MPLKIDPVRSFIAVPQDLREWGRWINEAFKNALSGTLDTAQVTDGAVTTAKLADGAATTAKIGALAVTTAKIADNAATLAKLAQVATDTLLGRSTAGTGNVETVVCTAAGRALIDDANAAAQRTTLGLGTAATQNTGTSGTNVPLLDGANVHSGASSFTLPPVMPTYTVAGVPSAATYARGLIYVSNESGGAVIAFSDGSSWRRLTDRSVIS